MIPANKVRENSKRTINRTRHFRQNKRCAMMVNKIDTRHGKAYDSTKFSNGMKSSYREHRYASIVEALPDVVFIIDSEGTFVDCEVGDASWLLVPKEVFLGANIGGLFPEDITKVAMGHIRASLDTKQLQIFDYELMHKDVRAFYEARITPLSEDKVMAIIRDISDLKLTQMNNEYLSTHDQLTGLYNRRYCESELIRLDSSKYLPLSIAMIDVNGLKLTNDAFGHIKGDELLQHVANILSTSKYGDEGFVARVGGDEFVMVMPRTDEVTVKSIVEAISKELEASDVDQPVISISIGWARKTVMEERVTDVFNIAEANMYRKKLEESRSMRQQTIKTILTTLNNKSEKEKRHAERVSAISKAIGKAMAMSYNEVKALETAGLLHDIGKITIDDEILNKKTLFQETDFISIKKHPESSYQILKSIDVYAGMAEDILSHHERWDGTGYPRGLTQEEIPLTARILSVADAYEAMTAERYYRETVTKEAAVAELEANAGTQFDPAIVRIFVDQAQFLLPNP